MNEIYAIFSGTESAPIWLEAVDGLSNARQRMEEIATQKPGHYFIYSAASQSRVTEIEEIPWLDSMEASNSRVEPVPPQLFTASNDRTRDLTYDHLDIRRERYIKTDIASEDLLEKYSPFSLGLVPIE